VARTSGLEVYSQNGDVRARETLARFELLRQFFNQNELLPVPHNAALPPLAVVTFRSEREYEDFRFRPNADAYYVGSDQQAYIITPDTASVQFATIEHEYAHYLIHAAGWKLPAWMDEGLAEFFSTVHITNRGCTLGGVLPGRLDTLHRHKWLPLAELVALTATSPELQTREGAEIFYAESWALTDLLIGSPEYGSHFRDLIARLSAGTPGAKALTATFGKSLDIIAGDLRFRVQSRSFTKLTYPAISQVVPPAEVSTLSDTESTMLLADVLTAGGQLQRAESLYAAVEQQSPGDPKALAALGTIALREHEQTRAIEYWRQAIDKGIDDADLCYRYAVLADEAGLPSGHIRRALERAVQLRPSFDDARYKLALLESNTSDFADAVKDLRAIRTVPPSRAFSYWSALSYASMELGDRTTAKSAAEKAAKCARTVSDRVRANQLEYMADTDLAVQFVHDSDGRTRLIETRVPHGTSDWNPFVEPTDLIQQAQGQLDEIICAGGKLTGLVLDTANGRIGLQVPDPRRVLIRNGPAEFTCGPQPPTSVEVQYAAVYADRKTGVVRGIAFR
jgi:Flp pilus assembly protein TadD